MITSFYMPTRIVAGQGSLATIGTLARELKMSRVLVVSHPVISQQPFHAAALAAPGEAGVATRDESGIEAVARISTTRADASAATASTAWSALATAR